MIYSERDVGVVIVAKSNELEPHEEDKIINYLKSLPTGKGRAVYRLNRKVLEELTPELEGEKT